MQFGQTIFRHSSQILMHAIHVFLSQILQLPLTSSLFTIDPQDSQHISSMKSLLQSGNKTARAEHFVIEQRQTLVAAEFSAFHTFPSKVLQSYGMTAVSTDKPEIH